MFSLVYRLCIDLKLHYSRTSKAKNWERSPGHRSGCMTSESFTWKKFLDASLLLPPLTDPSAEIFFSLLLLNGVAAVVDLLVILQRTGREKKMGFCITRNEIFGIKGLWMNWGTWNHFWFHVFIKRVQPKNTSEEALKSFLSANLKMGGDGSGRMSMI